MEPRRPALQALMKRRRCEVAEGAKSQNDVAEGVTPYYSFVEL